MTYKELQDSAESTNGLIWATQWVEEYGADTEATHACIDLVRKKDAQEYQE